MTTNGVTSWRPKAIIFDLMGTCLDWKSSILPTLKQAISRTSSGSQQHDVDDDAGVIATRWREGFFDEIHARFEACEPPEDIDKTHARVLIRLLNNDERWGNYAGISDEDVWLCVAAWHQQMGTHVFPGCFSIRLDSTRHDKTEFNLSQPGRM